jgi:hypothetical protein
MCSVHVTGVGDYLRFLLKKRIVYKVTDSVEAVETEGVRMLSWVSVKEVLPSTWGLADPIAESDLSKLRKTAANM